VRERGNLPETLRGPKLERAIGVIYPPDTERRGHYFHARLPDQFDAVLHFDETRAVNRSSPPPNGRQAATGESRRGGLRRMRTRVGSSRPSWKGGSTMAAVPAKFRDILEKVAFAHLGTLMPDGSPQVNPVWFEFDGQVVRVNSARGRQKDRNMRRDPRVALSVQDPANPYHYVQIRGRVTAIEEAGADEHIDRLAKRYLGVDRYPNRQPGEVRVIYTIEPERVSGM
jgi:PPOX class probable F420-dependent enzyme